MPAALANRLPGVVFQLHRRADGRLHFPYLAGQGLQRLGLTPQHPGEDARPMLERLARHDYPRLMVAIERSMREMAPISTRFRLHLKGLPPGWMAVRAQPCPDPHGVLWHGILLDISEQMAEEARLRHLSDTDDLTGLANRRHLMERLEQEISRSNRHGTPLSLMLMDLDRFKSINDTWGHLKGDEVLRTLAQLCRETLRDEDLLARLGGEEFALLLPQTAASQGQALAERLRRLIAGHDFALPGRRVTVSIGLAEHRIGETREQLIARADRRLYAAKHQGRNRVIAHCG